MSQKKKKERKKKKKKKEQGLSKIMHISELLTIVSLMNNFVYKIYQDFLCACSTLLLSDKLLDFHQFKGVWFVTRSRLPHRIKPILYPSVTKYQIVLWVLITLKWFVQVPLLSTSSVHKGNKGKKYSSGPRYWNTKVGQHYNVGHIFDPVLLAIGQYCHVLDL